MRPLACQWAGRSGAHHRHVGSKAKADLALANGCDHVILYNEEDFAARVKQISTQRALRCGLRWGRENHISGSCPCLKPRGMFVSFGSAGPGALLDRRTQQSRFAVCASRNSTIISASAPNYWRRRHLFAAVIQREAARADQPRLCTEGCRQGRASIWKAGHSRRVDAKP